MTPAAPDILTRLASDDPVVRYHACESVKARHADTPGLRERLVELLFDDTDWDAQNYVCAAASWGLQALDPTGESWIDDAVAPISAIIDSPDATAARAIIATVRSITTPERFIAWTKLFLPRPFEVDDGLSWAESTAEWVGSDWDEDVPLVNAMLALGGNDRRSTLLELLAAEQRLAVARETGANTEELVRVTTAFAESGQGNQADADRADTELSLRRNELAREQESVAVASARLAEVLSLDAALRLRPLEPTLVPIELVPIEFGGPESDLRTLI
ncbi:MAG: hypothetical protein AAFX05_04095, partial [Planctomycetota bacterium]